MEIMFHGLAVSLRVRAGPEVRPMARLSNEEGPWMVSCSPMTVLIPRLKGFGKR